MNRCYKLHFYTLLSFYCYTGINTLPRPQNV
nr:MAG TPA: hypothetical protein [Caudoviricetes sp.]